MLPNENWDGGFPSDWQPKDITGTPPEIPNNPPKYPHGLFGWQCPKCNCIYSPFTPECRNCNKSEYPVTQPTWC